MLRPLRCVRQNFSSPKFSSPSLSSAPPFGCLHITPSGRTGAKKGFRSGAIHSRAFQHPPGSGIARPDAFTGRLSASLMLFLSPVTGGHAKGICRRWLQRPGVLEFLSSFHQWCTKCRSWRLGGLWCLRYFNCTACRWLARTKWVFVSVGGFAGECSALFPGKPDLGNAARLCVAHGCMPHRVNLPIALSL